MQPETKNKGGRKPNAGIVRETQAYLITQIPFNYQIECKLMTVCRHGPKKGQLVKARPEPFYSALEDGLDKAIAMAEEEVERVRAELLVPA